MKAKELNGKVVAEGILDRVKLSVVHHVASGKRPPGLAVILVGDNPASTAYVGMKKNACARIGIQSFDYLLRPEDGESSLVDLIQSLNNDDRVDGILLQLPLPKGFDEDRMLELISPDKDVDGFHPMNVGKLLLGLSTFRSCTPYGVMELLRYYDIDPAGKHVVIVGRSNIVGKPLAVMMMQKETGANATVTVCHSRSDHLSDITSQADILVAAIGIPHFINADMVKPGATVIDVGINRVDDETSPRGYRLVGDVDISNVSDIASNITPVPGGVGPMTIAMLMSNTFDAYMMHH